MPSKMLVVIDMQTMFIHDHTRHVVEPVTQLVHRWLHAEQGPVILTAFENTPTSLWVSQLHWTKGMAAPETSLIPESMECSTNPSVSVCPKQTYSALPALQAQPTWQHTNEVHLCGVDTDSCVMATAFAVWDDGKIPVIYPQACASGGGAERHEAALAAMERNFGTLAQV